MRLRIPPVLVFVLAAAFMYVLDSILPVGEFSFNGQKYVMLFLFGVSVLIAFISLAQFFIAKTSVNPLNPEKASSLVVNGVYRYTRNPMYLVLLLLLTVWGFWLGNAFNALLVALFVKYMTAFQIQPEEEALILKFGNEYRKYCTKVRRWV